MDCYSCTSSCKICQASLGGVLFVRRENPLILRPALPTQRHVLPLPSEEIFSFQRVSSTISHFVFFEADLERDPTIFVQKMRQALEQVLVLYYPLSGRLRTTAQGKMELICSGEGMEFVESHADITLADLKKLEMSHWFQLQYDVQKERSTEIPLLTVQITRLACGGFVLGICVSEAVCEAMTIKHFMNTWIQFSQGKRDISVVPLWDREILISERRPLRFHFPNLSLIHDPKKFRCQHERRRTEVFVPRLQIDLSLEAAMSLLRNLLKEGFSECNFFEALAAHVWRERTRALALPHTKEVRLFFLADVCYTKNSTLPKAFYGQHAFNCQATTTAGLLLLHPLSYAVNLIQAAKKSLADSFVTTALDFADVHCPACWPPHGVLLLTHEKHRDEEMAYLDAVPYQTSHLNVASIGHPVKIPGGLQITMNNIPDSGEEKLRYYIRDGPSQFKMDQSRL